MIGKILSQLLGNAGEDFEADNDTYEELMEFEEGGWIIVNLPGERQNPARGAAVCYWHGYHLKCSRLSEGAHTDENWSVWTGMLYCAESELLSAPVVDPLENLLIEHPSMSVYQMRCRMGGAEEEELGSEEDEEDTTRLLPISTSSSHTFVLDLESKMNNHWQSHITLEIVFKLQF